MSYIHLLSPKLLVFALCCVFAGTHPALALAKGSPYLVVPDAAFIEASPAYRYANMTNDEAFAELDRRRILYLKLDPVPGVRAPIRLTGRLNGVYFHSSLPPDERVTSVFEILDARLALALDDFALVLARHDIDEVVHYTMYRPNVPPKAHDAEHRQNDNQAEQNTKHVTSADKSQPQQDAAIADTTSPDKSSPNPNDTEVKRQDPQATSTDLDKAQPGADKKSTADDQATGVKQKSAAKASRKPVENVAQSSRASKTVTKSRAATTTETEAQPIKSTRSTSKDRATLAIKGQPSSDAQQPPTNKPQTSNTAQQPATNKQQLTTNKPRTSSDSNRATAKKQASNNSSQSTNKEKAPNDSPLSKPKGQVSHDAQQALKSQGKNDAQQASKGKKRATVDKPTANNKQPSTNASEPSATVQSRSTQMDTKKAVTTPKTSAKLSSQRDAEPNKSTQSSRAKWAPPGTRHPAGLAIDVGALRKKDGTWLNVARHFHGHIGDRTCGEGVRVADQPEARELRAIVCECADLGIFTYVLTPNYNTAHVDHYHMEIKPGVRWFLYH